MANELGVLFLHHNATPVVLNNLHIARIMNPDATVVTMSAGKALNGGYSLEQTPLLKHLHSINAKRSSDWLVCSWFTQRREKCDKWWIIEWDVFCGAPAREYYLPVWDFPFVASTVKLRYRDKIWPWFRKIKNFPSALRPYAMGAVPFLYLLSDRALSAICDTLMSDPFTQGNGELRFATAANKCGFPPCAFSPPNDQITWIDHRKLKCPTTISHPVKFHVSLPMPKKLRQT